MTQLTIAAEDVQVGDLVYDAGYYAPNKWVKVKAVTVRGNTVELFVGHCNILLHVKEGIAVQR